MPILAGNVACSQQQRAALRSSTGSGLKPTLPCTLGNKLSAAKAGHPEARLQSVREAEDHAQQRTWSRECPNSPGHAPRSSVVHLGVGAPVRPSAPPHRQDPARASSSGACDLAAARGYRRHHPWPSAPLVRPFSSSQISGAPLPSLANATPPTVKDSWSDCARRLPGDQPRAPWRSWIVVPPWWVSSLLLPLGGA